MYPSSAATLSWSGLWYIQSWIECMSNTEHNGHAFIHPFTPTSNLEQENVPFTSLCHIKQKWLVEYIIYHIIVNILMFLRSTHDLVAMDGWLYAVGGNDGSSSLNSIEKYNPRSNKWVAASCMFTRRSSVGVAVLELLNFPPPSSPTLSVSSTSL